jgi:hypothetical protein
MLRRCSSGKRFQQVLEMTWCADEARFDPSLDAEVRTFSRNLLKRASATVVGRSKDGGVGQYGNYARKSRSKWLSLFADDL